MQILTLIPIAALVLGNVSLPLTGPEGPGHADLIRVAGSGSVTVDFGVVEYYPNLKSKLGLSSNIKRTDLIDAVPFVAEMGPGLMCSNIEFDYWYKWSDIEIPALQQKFEVPGDPTSRPVSMSPTPGPWMTTYETMIGNLNVSQLVQLTGAPAQFQTPMPASDVHLAPTDYEAAAALIASWTSAAKHPYPVRWSLWNEPGHTLSSIEVAEGAAASVEKKDASKAERKAAREAAKSERKSTKAGEKAAAADRSANAQIIADLFSAYGTAMRPAMGRWSQFGLASFISADFNAKRAADTGRVFFDEVMENLDPDQAVDFLSFNSFNGAWSTILHGARAVSAGQEDMGPVIFTQFAPPSMKFNSDGSFTKSSRITSSAMQVSLDMIDDFVQFQRATDVQHVCMTYWVGGDYGFLDSGGNGLRPTARYHAMKMFMDLPIARTRLDFGSTDLAARGVGGIAGRSQGKVAVLLWNQGDAPVSVPLALKGVPSAMQVEGATLTSLDDENPEPVTNVYDGGAIRLAPYGMALVEIASASIPDPLQRRNSISPESGGADFLQTRSFTDRTPATCQRGAALPGVDGCARNTGTYGFYDSVRSVAYLGMGEGRDAGRVTATYSGLPEQLYTSTEIFAVGADAPAKAVQISAEFDACGVVVQADAASDIPALRRLDFSAVPEECRRGAATFVLTLDGVPAGTQAEVYLGSDAAELRQLAEGVPQLLRAAAPDMDEGLDLMKPRKKTN